MIDKCFRFGLFATVSPSIDYAIQIASRQNVDLEVSTKSLESAIPDAKRMEAAGVELLLTSITNYSFLQHNVSIPVVTFRYQAQDIIDNFIKASEKTNKIILMMPKGMMEDVSQLEKLMGIHIWQSTFEDSASIRKALEDAKARGYQLVVGGGYINEYARKIGLSTTEYVRPKSVIQHTINEAIGIARSNREAREKSYRYQIILDSASDGVVVVNELGRITEINQTACELLKIRVQDAIHQPIDKIAPENRIMEALAKNRIISDSIEKVGRKTFVWTYNPFEVVGDVVGCVSTFREISSVMRVENKIRRTLSRGHVARYTINDLLYRSESMKETINDALQFAKTDSNLLITGETGTGKEILVQSIHNLSARKKYPFVSINCAALPEQLLESELFGHEEGAFTGSRKGGRTGLFELAHKGTILLDEIGETSQNLQIRLLRVLQEREIMRLGDDQLISIDVRIIAASNRDLAEEVKKNNFRSDLYYRLNVLRIHVPPLRERLDDFTVLLKEFIRAYSERNNFAPIPIPQDQIERLKTYSWPGNVRQLQNFSERLVLLSQSQFNQHVFDKIFREFNDQNLILQSTTSVINQKEPTSCSTKESGDDAIEVSKNIYKERINQATWDVEKKLLQAALVNAEFSRTQAAKDLGISRSTLWKKMKKVGLI